VVLIVGLPCFVTTIAFAALVFAPVVTRQPSDHGKRFQLVDTFSLVVLWQYPLALAQAINHLSAQQGDRSHEYVILGIFEVVVTAVWIGLARTLSEQGIHAAIPRFVAIAIGVPLGIVATMCVGISSTASAVAIASDDNVAAPATALELSLAGGAVSHLTLRWAMSHKTLASMPSTSNGEAPLSTSDGSG
jgi:hypothetical protein